MADLATPQPYTDPVAAAQAALDKAKADAAAKALAAIAQGTVSGPMTTPAAPVAAPAPVIAPTVAPDYASLFSSLLGLYGPATSEFAIAKTAGTSAIVLWASGLAITLGGIIQAAFAGNANSPWYVGAGVVIVLVGAVKQCLVSVGYGQSRAAVKNGATAAVAAVANANAAASTAATAQAQA